MIRPATLVLLIGTSLFATAATRNTAQDARAASPPTPDDWNVMHPDIHVGVKAAAHDMYEVYATVDDVATGRPFAALRPLVYAGGSARGDAGSNLPGAQVVSFDVTVAPDGRTASAVVEVRRDGIVASRSTSTIAVER